MFRRVILAASLAAVAALLAAGAALADAGGRGTVTITTHAHNVVLFSDPATNPCTGEPGTFTATAGDRIAVPAPAEAAFAMAMVRLMLSCVLLSHWSASCERSSNTARQSESFCW